MKEIKTVNDLIFMLHEKIQSGELAYDSPVKKISGGKYLNHAKFGVAKQSKKDCTETVSRMGIACFVIEQ